MNISLYLKKKIFDQGRLSFKQKKTLKNPITLEYAQVLVVTCQSGNLKMKNVCVYS